MLKGTAFLDHTSKQHYTAGDVSTTKVDPTCLIMWSENMVHLALVNIKDKTYYLKYSKASLV